MPFDNTAAHPFFTRGADDGSIASGIRSFDWSATALGPLESWPAALNTLVGVVLASRQPMFLAWGRDRTWLYNDAFVPILGRKHPQALGLPSRQVWAEAWGELEPLFERVFGGESLFRKGYAIGLDRGGAIEPAYFDFSYTPVHTEDGSVAGLFGTCIETTDRVAAERIVRTDDLRQSLLVELADRFRELEDPADLSFAAAELLGRALGVSRAGYGTVDTVAETITIERDWNAPGIASLAGVLRFRDYGSYIEDLKRGVTVVVYDAAKDPRTAAGAEALKSISAQSFVNMPVSERSGLVALLYLNHAVARPWTIAELGMIRDVAEWTRVAVERRRAEEELRALAASLERQVVERTQERDRVWRHSRDLLVVIGADGIFRAVNPAWAAVLGYPPEDLVGRSYLDFMWPDDVERTRRGLEAAVAGRNLTGFENRFAHQDGTPRWISWHTAAEGDLVFGSGRDITLQRAAQAELATAQEALRQSQKMESLGQLTGGIAHDFNNLLGGISASLELLRRRLMQNRLEDAERYISAALGAARRAAALTHRLLAFARRQTLDPRPTDIHKLVRGMEELIRRSVGPVVEVEVVAAAGLWSTKVDASQLESSLLNLCINARDAMAPDGGRLTIAIANEWLDERVAGERQMTPGAYVCLSVTDTGSGMAPATIARAFDPFFTTKPLGQGTGLGLSMVHGFVHQSGGQVRIESSVGAGTTLYLYLPRHAGAADAPGIEAPLPVEPGTGETVVVIDDEPTIRMLVVDLLEEQGYVTHQAADGPSGLALLQSEHRIDLLVTDVGLPGGMNGRQVADAARIRRPGLKVLFITGFAETAVLGDGHLGAGMAVMTKPFALAALAQKVREMIDGRAPSV